RREKDSMGPMEVPADAYYGASTERARLNFPISDLRFKRPFIRALGLVKSVAASVNSELGLLDAEQSKVIQEAASEVADGRWDRDFVVDIFQTGSGTSTNMNANEVIANRATEIMGGDRGAKLIHPNDHVNKGQSSNDVIPTAIHVAAVTEIQGTLIPALEVLEASLREKSKEFWGVVKTGRTHLQDATPIRLGQEFLGYAGQIERGIARAKHAQDQLSEVALGGTAVGTGVNTHPDFARLVCAALSETLGVEIRETDNHFQAQNTLDSVLEASGSLRTIAVSLYKIANDVRWMGSGPRAGIGEIALPEVQPGSSIMPGKINPVIAESVIQVVGQVIGSDATICQAAQGGYFELNMMMPVAAHNLLQQIELLTASATNFSKQCVRGLMLATALAPAIGYDAAASVAKEAARTGQTIREVATERTDLSAEQLDELLNAEAMTEPK
ncbi:MAG: class II fumarate hydratase, partial [Dehalococcoidia bacterium]